MIVAIDIRSLLDGRLSGIERYTVNLVAAMTRVAPENQYRLFLNSARSLPVQSLPLSAEVHAFRYPNKIFNALQWALSWPRWDQLVSADCFFMPSFRLLPLSREKPMVATVHDLSYEHFPELFSWRRRLWHRAMGPRGIFSRADHLIAVSDFTARDLVATYGLPTEMVSVVPSGVALPAASAAARVVQRYRLPPRFILCMATLEPRKNVPSVIAAFSAIAERVPHHLVIAGLPGWLTQEIEAAVAKSPVIARLHFPGFIAEADKAAVYAAATLFVYPSFYEGFGFPPLEALVAGTPVVTSYNSSLPEVVGEWATLVDPWDRGELAAVLLEQLGAPQRVPPATQQAIGARYSWDATARATLAVIAEVL